MTNVEYIYTGELPPDRFNLAQYCLARSAQTSPDKIALYIVEQQDGTDARCITYGELEDSVLRIASGFAGMGFDRGERVFLRMGNSLDYALMFFAANAVGLVPIPASAMLSEFEVTMLLKDSGAICLVSDGTLPIPALPGNARLIGPEGIAGLKRSPAGTYASTGKDDPAYLIYTSGTSGRPKGVLHAQRAVWGRRPMYQGWYGISSSDVMLHTGAFNWTYTLGTGLSDPWANGAAAVLYTGPRDIAVWPRLVERYGATIMASVPALYRQMLKYCDLVPSGLSPLRHVLCAGEALSQSLHEKWLEQTSVKLCEALGMSEISTYISHSPADPVVIGSPGKPQPGRCVVLLPAEGGGTQPLPPGDVGLIAVHRTDPGLMLGYWKRPDEQAAVIRGEWFVGGDMARMDEAGYIHFLGRNDDLMNASGYRVSPQEVENAIASHANVAEVAVGELGVRQDVSIIAAFVVLQSGLENKPNENAIIAHSQEHLADYKVPRAVHFVDQLPRSPNGKLNRKQLCNLA